MDITSNELKTMKAKQLRRIIREAIEEVLAEGNTYAGKDAVDDMQKDPKFGSLSGTGKTDALNKLKQGGSVTIGEGDLDELARLAKGFRLADPNFDASEYTNKRVSGTSLADIINYFRENPGAEKSQLQSQFNFVRPQIANAVVNALLDAGVLVKLGAGGEVEATPEPGEEQPEKIDGPEALFVGSGDLSQYFDNEPNAGGEEDFNTEEEPTVGDVEPGIPASSSSMSDEDYEAFMKYTELKDRLDATKSNLIKMKRRKGGTAGDISDVPSTDEQRLRNLKKKLEDKINSLVAGSDYLKKRIEKQTGKPVEPIETPEEETEEDTIDEAYDAEYERRKLQFYAGIIK